MSDGFKIKQVSVRDHPITGQKQYQYLVIHPGGGMTRAGTFNSKSRAIDDVNVLIAKFKASEEGRPVNIKTNNGTETVEVKANPSYAADIKAKGLTSQDGELRKLTEDPNNPGFNLQGQRLVTQEERDSLLGPAKANVAVADPAKLEQVKSEYESYMDLIRKEDPNSSVTNLDQQRLEEERAAMSRMSGATTTPQAGTTGAPTPTTGETFGETGALETTQTTPGVTQTGTTTDYTPPAPTPVDPTTGVSTLPTQTGGLSALPPSVTYATQPAGTPGYVQQSLLTPSTSGTGPTTYDQWMQSQGQTTQQAGYIVTMPDGTEQTISYGQPIPVGAVIKQYVTGAAKGGMMRKGYAAGGMPSEDPMLEAKYRIAAMNGYNGPKTNAALNSFANSSEGMKRKFNAIGTMMNKGGLMAQGYQSGGVVKQNDSGQYIVQFPDGTATVFGMGDTGKQQAESYLASLPSDTGTAVGITGSTGTTITSPTATTYVEGDEAVTPPAGTTDNTVNTLDLTSQYAQQYGNLIGSTLSPVQSAVSRIDPQAEDFVPLDAGQTAPVAPFAEAAKVQTTAQAALPAYLQASQMQPVTAAGQVQQATAGMQAAQGQVSQQAQAQAAQQETTSVAGLEAAQGQAIMMDNPVQREIQQGELISGVADAEKAAQFNEQIQAAQATPTKQATVQGQLESLMQQFEGGETPAWAAGSMRTAMATLSARGLGASSMAGQAVIQATMEAALPIAQMDAQTTAQFEAQNLSNRQQRAMLAAQQRAQFLGMEFDQAFQARVANSARIGDVANMNFTAEQQVALENSRAANTMNLNNLSNRQAMVMAEAAALSNLDMANLNNRQQAAVQNAQNFMQMDMANLSNEQQTTMFKAQQNIQALFTDQAAENAAAQFNASSENQTNQFFANLSSQTSQFNASQQNAMDQFNVNSVNALREFNAEIQQQRDLFNAQNGLVVAQANAQWRQNLATLNTAAQNESNMNFAKTINALTATNLDAYWQRERDIMSYAFQTANNNADRSTAIFKQQLVNDQEMDQAKAEKSAAFAAAAANFVDKLIFG